MDKARNSRRNQFFITYTSAIANGTPDPRVMSTKVNPPIYQYLRDFDASPANVGIVAMDFITKDIAWMIYTTNFINPN